MVALAARLPLYMPKWGTDTMFRISKIEVTDATTLRLEGSLSGLWVEELRRICEATLVDGEKLTVDCGGISFSDAEGITLMRELRRHNVDLTNCSPFLKFQLEQGPAV